MKLTFIGSGSAFTTDGNYQSNMVLEAPSGRKLLIDCGSDARHALRDIGLSHRDIDSVYISHMHADHTGGLEWLGFSTKFDPACARPRLFISQFLKDELWQNVLSGGMRSIQGEIADLDTYFEVHKIVKNGSFLWEGVRFQLIQTVHIMDGYHLVPSFGLLFTVGGGEVFVTTDTQFAPEQLMDFYRRAGLIFQDCETTQFPSTVHAHYSRLRTLPEDIRGRMWLYHYQPGPLPDASTEGFRGFVRKGQVFDLALEVQAAA